MTFDTLAVDGSGVGTVSNTANTGTVTVALTPDAQTATRSIDRQYAAPYLSGNNNLYFGATYTGAEDPFTSLIPAGPRKQEAFP